VCFRHAAQDADAALPDRESPAASFCYTSLQTRFDERFAAPKILSDLVDAGRLGTKTGGGFIDIASDRTPELIAYRNKAYVKMQQLLDELGPAPTA
jgi:3-hydroxybutyryl-CoA dehydrogenase